MRSLLIYLLLTVAGCALLSPKGDLPKFRPGVPLVRSALPWQPSYIHLSRMLSGIVLELSPAVSSPGADTTEQNRRLLRTMSGFEAVLWASPPDTSVRNYNQYSPEAVKSATGDFFEIRSDPFVFRGDSTAGDSSEMLPFRVDGPERRYFFCIPPGRYLLWIPSVSRGHTPEIVRDLEVREGDFSVVPIVVGNEKLS
ncbi:MAG TPA: hypothetical protein VMW43_07490 [Bacteroidota bacterium]|nr:hypothetical protein [Bacteroidota bacterium]